MYEAQSHDCSNRLGTRRDRSSPESVSHPSRSSEGQNFQPSKAVSEETQVSPSNCSVMANNNVAGAAPTESQKYLSTRGGDYDVRLLGMCCVLTTCWFGSKLSFENAVLKGLAADGGLFLPHEIPIAADWVRCKTSILEHWMNANCPIPDPSLWASKSCSIIES